MQALQGHLDALFVGFMGCAGAKKDGNLTGRPGSVGVPEDEGRRPVEAVRAVLPGVIDEGLVPDRPDNEAVRSRQRPQRIPSLPFRIRAGFTSHPQAATGTGRRHPPKGITVTNT